MPDRDLLFEALIAVCSIEPNLYGRARLNKELSLLRAAGVTPGELTQYGNWYARHDWRGKKGEPPTPAIIRETWGMFKAWRAMQPPPPASPPAAPTPCREDDAEYLEHLYEQALETRADGYWDELAPEERAAKVRAERDKLEAMFPDMPSSQLKATAAANARWRWAAKRLSFAEFLIERERRKGEPA